MKMQSIKSTNLQEVWFNSFVQRVPFNSNRTQLLQAFPSFNQMNNFHGLLDLMTDQSAIYFYQSEKVNRLSHTYGSFIKLLEEKEEALLRDLLKIDLRNWQIYKTEQREQAISTENQFESLFIEWLRQMGVATGKVSKYFEERKSNALNQRIYQAVNQYNNPWSFHSGVPIYKKNGGVLENVLSFNQNIFIDFHSNAARPDFELSWFNQVQSTEVPFFEASGFQDFDQINDKVNHQTAISIQAKLNGLNQLPVEPTDWFDERLINDLLDNSSVNHDILTVEEKEYYRLKLKNRIQKLYLINGFQMKIELMNRFTSQEYDLIANQKLKCFPFYFDVNINCKQKVVHKADGSIEIQQKCNHDVPLVIAADLKQLYRS